MNEIRGFTVDELIVTLLLFRALFGGDLTVVNEEYSWINDVDLASDYYNEDDRPVGELFCMLTWSSTPGRPHSFEDEIMNLSPEAMGK